MSSLQKMIADVRELDVSEIDLVTGGNYTEAACETTETCYTDAKGKKHCVKNFDDCY